jgi:hypothetical protein
MLLLLVPVKSSPRPIPPTHKKGINIIQLMEKKVVGVDIEAECSDDSDKETTYTEQSFAVPVLLHPRKAAASIRKSCGEHEKILIIDHVPRYRVYIITKRWFSWKQQSVH